MKRKTVGLTSRASIIIALAFIMVASLALLPLDDVAYAQTAAPTLTASATSDGTRVSVSWTEVTDADGYTLVRRVNGGNWEPSRFITDTSYSDPNVEAGMTYGYYVRAGTSGDWSNYASATVPGGVSPPAMPANLRVNADGVEAVDVTWDAVTDADSYTIYRWDGEGLWIRDLTETSYRDENLTPGLTHSYNIRAVNTAGVSVWSGYQSVTLDPATDVPVLTLTHTSREVVDLAWTQVVGTDVEYELERMTDVTGGAVSDVDFERIGGGLLTRRTHTDSEAVYVGGSTSTRYIYRVTAIVNGIEGDPSEEVEVRIPPTGNIPATPVLRVTSTELRSITVEWDPISDAASYEIHFKGGDNDDYVNPIGLTNVSYRHTSLYPGTMYTYQVRSKNVNGHSEWSDEASAETHVREDSGEDTGVLSTPTNLRVSDATTESSIGLTLSWNPVSGATGYKIMTWVSELHMGDDPDATVTDITDAWKMVTQGSATGAIPTLTGSQSTVSFTGYIAVDGDTAGTPDTQGSLKLKADTPYYFVILAVKDNNNSMDMSNWSAPVRGMAEALKPDPPTGLKALTTGSTSIWLSWDAPAADTTKNPTGYTIFFNWSDGNGRINVKGTTFAHTGLRPNTNYYYRVRAMNSNISPSDWEPSQSSQPTQVMATTAPRDLEMPTGLKAADASMLDTAGGVTTPQILVSWGNVSGASMYEIQKWVAPKWVLIGTTDKTSFTDKTVTAVSEVVSGGSYHYIIRATNGEVTSPWSTSVLGRARPAAAGAYMPVLTLDPIGQTLTRLTWTEVSGATGYELEYHSGNWDASDFEDDKSRDTNARLTLELGSHRYYVHFGRKSGTRYSYRIRAILPHTKSDWSNVKQVVTRPVRPDMKASVDGTTVNLSWKPVSVDGAARGMAFYKVERREASPTDADWGSAGVTIDCENDDGSVGDECTASDDRAADVGSSEPAHKYDYRIRVVVDSSSAALAQYDHDDDETADVHVPNVMSYWTQVRTQVNSMTVEDQ